MLLAYFQRVYAPYHAIIYNTVLPFLVLKHHFSSRFFLSILLLEALLLFCSILLTTLSTLTGADMFSFHSTAKGALCSEELAPRSP